MRQASHNGYRRCATIPICSSLTTVRESEAFQHASDNETPNAGTPQHRAGVSHIFGSPTSTKQIFLEKGLLGDRTALLSTTFPISNKVNPMARICAITGKRPVKGGRIIRKGLTKKSGGIGTSLVKNTRRRFRPNVQRIRVKLPSGEVKRMWVSAKAIKAGKVTKA